jgi:TniQ
MHRSRPSAFLIRPRPFPDESLSSWRQRTGWENLYKLFPISDERTRRVDPDLAANEEDLEFAELLHGSTAETVRHHTLRRWASQLGSQIFPRSHPQWWLGAAYGSTASGHGSMYCPQCLAEDSIPYFRLRWRLSFVTSCDIHKIRLKDCCPKCGRAPWPAGCGRKTVLHPSFTSLRHCWHCGIDLSTAGKVVVEDGQFLWKVLDGCVTQFGAKAVPTSEIFSAHRLVWRLLTKSASQKRILAANPEWLAPLARLAGFSRGPKLDQLCAQDRATISVFSEQILEDGVPSFIKFARRCAFLHHHFEEFKDDAPAWLLDAISQHLAVQNRRVTNEDVATAYRAIEAETGQRPTRAAVWKRLNWEGYRGFEGLFDVRTKATPDERQLFITRLLDLVNGSGKGKRSIRAHLIYACAILIQISALPAPSHPLEVISRAKLDILRNFVQRASTGWAFDPDLDQEFSVLLPRVEELLSGDQVDLLQDKYSQVQFRKHVSALMRDFPADLSRRVSVFSLTIGEQQYRHTQR